MRLLVLVLLCSVACSDSGAEAAAASTSNIAPIAPGTPSPPRASPSPNQMPSQGAPQMAYPPMPPAGSGPALAQGQWVAAFKPQFLRLSCHPEFFFRQCFQNVDDAECNQRMTQLVAQCVADPSIGLPPVIQGMAQSQQAGFRVGSCAGERYERAYIAEGRRISNPRCDDANNWTEPPQ